MLKRSAEPTYLLGCLAATLLVIGLMAVPETARADFGALTICYESPTSNCCCAGQCPSNADGSCVDSRTCYINGKPYTCTKPETKVECSCNGQ